MRLDSANKLLFDPIVVADQGTRYGDFFWFIDWSPIEFRLFERRTEEFSAFCIRPTISRSYVPPILPIDVTNQLLQVFRVRTSGAIAHARDSSREDLFLFFHWLTPHCKPEPATPELIGPTQTSSGQFICGCDDPIIYSQC